MLNIAAYRFVALQDLGDWKARLEASARSADLLGTVLLAPEGINLFLAGPETALRAWLEGLREETDDRGARPFGGLKAKESWSEGAPFKRLRVRVKREIIRMDTPTIMPAAGRAPSVDGRTLQRWLDRGVDDEGRPVLTLDTRNRFEVEAGRFRGALDWQLTRFGEFPQALQAALAQQGRDLREHTVVSYCTGGIRCEKAALLMQAAGLQRVYQLEGGILQYFEDTQGSAPHWEGRCVVFDERGELEPDLSPHRAGAAPRTDTPPTPPKH